MVLFPLNSCKDYLDINKNPNYPTSATLDTLLASVSTTTISAIGYSGYVIGSMWMQYTTQGNTGSIYHSLVNYSLNTDDYNSIWKNAYANTLLDIKYLLEMAEEEEAWNYWVIGKILMAYNFHILTDFYGDIPFTEALDPTHYPYPQYDDSQTVVYPGILALLEEALARQTQARHTDNPEIGNEDFYFQGDMERWITFAKSLKLKILMRDFYTYHPTIRSLLAEGGFLEEDCTFTGFEDVAYKGNPFYEFNIRTLNSWENVRACHTFTEFLITHEDPRIAEYYIETLYSATLESPTPRQIYGSLPCGTLPSSEEEEESVPVTHSSPLMQAYNDPVYLMNSAEVAFLRAEAYARMAEFSQAKAAYDEGVIKAFARWGYNASAHIAPGGYYEFDDSDIETMLNSIMLQKWVAAAKANTWDAFFDRNRTGYPEISTASKVRISNQTEGLMEGYELGTLVTPGNTVLQPYEFPHRMLVPSASSSYNPNAPATKSLTTPLWWHKNYTNN
ncbi:MAG: SusD/RagB family nutrient-binding outer membrane lipoprotein [Tannerellaceae bacterium]|nr:SusD/RagB family nutrient-binding outer membrane lipoprotein [Tannerellaceae bacterium]